jgi:hypothetical protein
MKDSELLLGQEIHTMLLLWNMKSHIFKKFQWNGPYSKSAESSLYLHNLFLLGYLNRSHPPVVVFLSGLYLPLKFSK